MQFINYYEVLQISPTASPEIIKAAYRQLCKTTHPDVSNYDEKKFMLIKEAHDTLSDVHKRNEYDLLWRMNMSNRESERVNAEKEFQEKEYAESDK
ncbi:J domain-containing protein [Paenibacillus sp. YAF4_2]|uniref:J domain-containing protein n=1 Tax=Paenibacillus sp. YAF4_2 TaxID=3233085 RepID=UPI003F987621